MVCPMEERVGYELKRAQQALRAAMDGALERHELTAPQYAALAILEGAAGISSAELARRCFVTPQTMSAIVAGLQRRGLVGRRPHAQHGRILRTQLTAAGAALLARAHDDVRAVEARMTSSMSDAERHGLADLLRRCAAGLEHAPPDT